MNKLQEYYKLRKEIAEKYPEVLSAVDLLIKLELEKEKPKVKVRREK